MEGAATPASAPAVAAAHQRIGLERGLTDYLWGRLGLTADLRGYYGTRSSPPNPYNIFKPSISEYTFMAGPQYRFVRREHWAISGQVLVGGSKGNFNANGAEVPGTLVGLWSNGTNFSAARVCRSTTTSVRGSLFVFSRAIG
jgi:hypothetical protein